MSYLLKKFFSKEYVVSKQDSVFGETRQSLLSPVIILHCWRQDKFSLFIIHFREYLVSKQDFRRSCLQSLFYIARDKNNIQYQYHNTQNHAKHPTVNNIIQHLSTELPPLSFITMYKTMQNIQQQTTSYNINQLLFSLCQQVSEKTSKSSKSRKHHATLFPYFCFYYQFQIQCFSL